MVCQRRGSGPYWARATTRDVSSVKECQRLLGFSRGERMMEMVERVTGAPCACLRGEPCILIPPAANTEESVDGVTLDAVAGF